MTDHGNDDDKANKDLILAAVNSYDSHLRRIAELEGAFNHILRKLLQLRGLECKPSEAELSRMIDRIVSVLPRDEARAAIARAEGKKVSP